MYIKTQCMCIMPFACASATSYNFCEYIHMRLVSQKIIPNAKKVDSVDVISDCVIVSNF